MPVEEFDYNAAASYLNYYPPQQLMAFVFSIALRIAGNNSFSIVLYLNTIFAAFWALALCIIARQFTKRIGAVFTTGAILVLFVPIVFYDSYFYGTIGSASLCAWSLCATLAYLRGNHAAYLAVPALLMPIANMLYTSTLLATFAIACALLLNCSRKRLPPSIWLPCVAAIAIMGTGYLLLTAAADRAMPELPGYPASNGVPAAAYISMGLTSGGENAACGAGSYDGSNKAFLTDAGMDTRIADQNARQSIRSALGDYADGTRSLSFFLEKTARQWLDPWFSSSALTIEDLSKGARTKPLDMLYKAGAFIMLEKLLKMLMPFVYCFSAAAFFLLARRKKSPPGHSMLALYFLFGFVFQFVWEQKARYCLPYFVVLIPFAACGLFWLADEVRKAKSDQRTGEGSA